MPSNSKRSANQPANSSKQNSTANAPAKPTPNATSTNASNTRLEKSVSSNAAGGGGQATNRNDMSTAVPEAQPNPVNRKKQKRRQKQAARLAEQQMREGTIPANAISPNGDHTHADRIDEMHAEILRQHQSDSRLQYEVSETFNAGLVQDAEILARSSSRVIGQSYDLTKRKGKKKKNKRNSSVPEGSVTSHSAPSITRPIAPSHSLSNAFRSAHAISKDRIWNTSTHEERENIKEFWLQLGEEERRSLVKVEKEAVLRKMKEQQKHSCSCTVCGRKRTAIEEELEVLYDAYYEELEQYANNNQGSLENGASLRLPPRVYQTPLHALGRHHHHHHPHPPNSRHPPGGRIREISDDEEDEVDEEYDEDDEDDEPYSDDDLEDEARTTRTDFFAFGNSLTVKDGILTVADDLLKNDGKHFIDMMEQLAERRMQREEETQYAASSAAHQSMQPGHNHGPPLDEEEYDEEEEEDYDSQEEDEFEEDEMDTMTEEQRMEEGRRMFQIFAARMFEQRVLTAYREKVARERQQRLIEELEEESRLDEEREAKKAKEAQRKKDKKRMQKQAKEEERAKREADRAAEEAAQKALEAKKQEEQRRKKEEQRKKRELEKKAQEEERLRKEAEKQKRLKEERERQAEYERKQREQKEKEKKKREEARKKERDEKEAKEKEKEQRKKKSKEERDRKAREEQAKQEKDAAARGDRESKEQIKQAAEEFSQPTATQASVQAAKRASQSTTTAFLPPGLQHPSVSTSLHSPHFQVATPVVPKAPTPVRPRQPSQQGSHASSPRSQFAHTENSQTSISPGAAGTSQSSGTPSLSGRGLLQHPILQHPQPNAPMPPLGGVSRGPQSMGFSAVPTLNGIPPNPPGIGGMGHRMPLGHDSPIYSSHPGPVGGPFRNFGSPDSIPLPPGINAPRHLSQGRGYPLDTSHGGLPFHPSMGPSVPPSSQAGLPSRESISHTGQPTAPFDRKHLENQPHSQPISRPTPIQRPSSTVPLDQIKDGGKVDQQEIDALSTQLGSSALLDDTDVPLSSGPSQPIPMGPPGLPGAGRMSFGTSPLFSESLNSAKSSNFPLGPPPGSTWGPQIPFGPPGFPGSASWRPNTGAAGWSNNAFGIIGGPHRSNTSRPVTIRLLMSQACKQLSSSAPLSEGNSGFHNVNQVLRQIEQLNPQLDVPITLDEMLDICDTEGNSQNGGGSFAIKNEGSRGTSVKFEPDNNASLSGVKGSAPPGDIGSPVPSASHPVPVGVGSPLISNHLHK